jgi:hypothetical protein
MIVFNIKFLAVRIRIPRHAASYTRAITTLVINPLSPELFKFLHILYLKYE